MNYLKAYVVERPWGDYIVGIKCKENVKELFLITSEEGRWPVISIK